MSNPRPRQTPAIMSEIASDKKVLEVKDDNFGTWLKQVYDINLIKQEDLNDYYEIVKYHGFDRMEVLKQLFLKFPDPLKVAWIIILVALRGPKAASETKMPDGSVLSQIGVPASGGQGSKILTCNKIQAATADLAAFYLKRLNIPKRLNVPLPGWLQFPSAGSIKLPENLREQHIEFHKRFSVVIGGQFNEAIYGQMQANSYLDQNLNLFP